MRAVWVMRSAQSVQKVGGTDGVVLYEKTVEWMASAGIRVG